MGMEEKGIKFKTKDPLNKEDTENQTLGCRAFQPDYCLNYLTSRCAFCREDKICLAPPRGWKTTYKKLKENK